ncbi:BolA-like family protein, partial [Quillaja saponaria]
KEKKKQGAWRRISGRWGVTKERVGSSLKSRLNPSDIVRCKFCNFVSEQFEGKRLLERHRMVNAALEEEMKDIHALSVKKAATPNEWKKLPDAAVSNSNLLAAA